MKYIYLLLPFTIGIALTAQAAINGQLRTAMNSPLLATLISFLVGTILLVAIFFISNQSIPSVSQMTSVKWHTYTGGVLGAFIVMAVIVSIRNVNPSTLFALIVAGQLITAIIFEHYGLLGVKVDSISWYKISGLLLLVVAVYLLNKKS